MTKLAMVMAYYDQPHMMAKQVETWDSYPREIQEDLEIIVVDDGSPNVPFELHGKKPYDLRIYRVEQDIPWNQPGCKNLAFRKVRSPWAITMDPDMVLTTRAMTEIRKLRLQAGHHYKLALNHTDGSKLMDFASPNFYIVEPRMFWAAGGYNEDFSGHKGYSDVVLHRILNEVSKRHEVSIAADFYNVNDLPDAQVVTLDRDCTHNKKLFNAAIKFAETNGWARYHETHAPKGWMRFKWKPVR